MISFVHTQLFPSHVARFESDVLQEEERTIVVEGKSGIAWLAPQDMWRGFSAVDVQTSYDCLANKTFPVFVPSHITTSPS